MNINDFTKLIQINDQFDNMIKVQQLLMGEAIEPGYDGIFGSMQRVSDIIRNNMDTVYQDDRDVDETHRKYYLILTNKSIPADERAVKLLNASAK